MANPTKAERRSAWKSRTTATAKALKSSGATVTVSKSKSGKKTVSRSVPLSATVVRSGQTTSELVKQAVPAGGAKFVYVKPKTPLELARAAKQQKAAVQPTARQIELDKQRVDFARIERMRKPVVNAPTPTVQQAGVLGGLSFTGSRATVERKIEEMEQIGIPKKGKITSRIKRGQEKTSEFLQERKKASEELGLLGMPTAKMIGAIDNVNQMFTGVPGALEMVVHKPKLIAPGAVILAHGATIGTAEAFKEDPIQTTMEFMLMGKLMNMAPAKTVKPNVFSIF